jgi:hypothetical protein
MLSGAFFGTARALIAFRLSEYRPSDRKGLSSSLKRRFLHDALETVLRALDSVLKLGPIVGEEASDPEGFFSRSHTDLMENVCSNGKLMRCGLFVPKCLMAGEVALI